MSQQLIVDGRVVELESETDLSTPLVHVLKTRAHCQVPRKYITRTDDDVSGGGLRWSFMCNTSHPTSQSVKVGCSEGACGACAVQVWYKDDTGL